MFKGDHISPESTLIKKKSKPKIISIKSLKKAELDNSDILKDKSLLEECDRILEKEVPGFRSLQMERITPSVIMKFSKGFDKIIQLSNVFYTETKTTGLNESSEGKNESVFHFIKLAYESFIKRIVGINDICEIESVLHK